MISDDPLRDRPETDKGLEKKVEVKKIFESVRDATCTTWEYDGVLHRPEGPALVVQDANGVVQIEAYYRFGDFHRLNGRPAYTDRYDERLEFYEYGKLHREAGPAIFYWHEDQSVPTAMAWYRHGERHRLGGPCRINIEPDTQVETIVEWRVDGELHCEQGPAYIERHPETGVVTIEQWARRGKLMRLDGSPHSIYRDGKGGHIIHTKGGSSRDAFGLELK